MKIFRDKNTCRRRLLMTVAVMFALGSAIWVAPSQVSGRSVGYQSVSKVVDEQKTQEEIREAAPKSTSYVDIDGKRIKQDETFVAQRTLSDGRTILYRKNKREIQALVKALKEDGVTDERLLDSQTWGGITCALSPGEKCKNNCGIYRCTLFPVTILGPSPANKEARGLLRYCSCPL